MAFAGDIGRVFIIVKENNAVDNGTFKDANGTGLPYSSNPPPNDLDRPQSTCHTRKTTAVKAQFVDLARVFTLCDKHFTDVARPSTTNHLTLIAGESPIINNPPRSHLARSAPLVHIPSLPRLLNNAKITWGNHGGYTFSMIQELYLTPTLPSEQFAIYATARRMPGVSRVYPSHDASEFPPDPQRAGNPLIGKVTHRTQCRVDQINAIAQGGSRLLHNNDSIFRKDQQ